MDRTEAILKMKANSRLVHILIDNPVKLLHYEDAVRISATRTAHFAFLAFPELR